jgi:branched-chain amino acid transport system substrate-binding protein
MKKRVLLIVSLTAAALAVVAATAGTGAAAVERSTAVSCNGTLRIALASPLTGPAAFLGQDQKSWAVLAAKRIAPGLGLKAQIIDADTQLDPAVASTAVQKFLGDQRVIGVVGPATSGAVAATSKAMSDAKLLHISPSATRTSLTKSVGDRPREASPGFFRVVADDSVQGTGDAKFMVEKLNAKKVTVFDAQEPYSVGLANAVEAYLKGKNVNVQRQSVTNNTTDFSANVSRIPSDTDVVFTPFQVAANAQQIAVLLREQGKKAVVFGGDGTVDPAFKFPGSYVSNFAPDLTIDASKKAIVDAWKADNPGKDVLPFGPPAYGAVQVILNAAKKACTKKGGQIDRVDVLRAARYLRVPDWILGGTFRFSTKTGDPLNGGFWLFQIQSDGSLKQLQRL